MSDYAKLTDYAIKDSLTTGDPDKVVKGEELDDEFNAVSTTIATKADKASPALTGTPTAPTASLNTNTTQIATTAFVVAEVADAVTDERSATATLTNKTLTAPTINGGTISDITDLAVADGGTGSSSITANSVILGNGSSALSGNLVAPNTSGNVLTSNGTTWQSTTPTNYNSTTVSSTSTLTSNLAGTTRVLGTTYTNSTAKPRVVYVSGSNINNTFSSVSINGTAVMYINGYGTTHGCSFIVPPAATYSVSSGAMNLTLWFEYS